MLEKLYDLLAMPVTDLYRDIHAALAKDDEPVPVDAQPAPKGFAIPPKPLAAAAPFVNMDRVRLKIAETREVSTLLSAIFADEETAVVQIAAREEANTIGTL